jgi:hypothetical protein
LPRLIAEYMSKIKSKSKLWSFVHYSSVKNRPEKWMELINWTNSSNIKLGHWWSELIFQYSLK